MDWIVIEREVDVTAIRSRGPGGQNVNKVSSAARLTWLLWSSKGLSDEEKLRVQNKLTHRINQNGEVYLRSDQFRDFPQNKNHCMTQLHELLVMALRRKKKRRPTKPTYASKQKKRQGKTKRSEVKNLRKRVSY